MALPLPDRLSRQSIHARLATLTRADYRRLAVLARVRAWGSDLDPDDLLHDAILRAYVSRTCRSDVPVIAFLVGIMRSLVSQHVTAANAHVRVQGLWNGLNAPSVQMPDVAGETLDEPSMLCDAEERLARVVADDVELERLAG